MAIKKINSLHADKVVKAVSEYYRDCPMYLYLANSMDAKNWINDNIGQNIKDIINLGYSYESAGNYIVACNVNELQEQNPKLYEETFSMYSSTIKFIQREQKTVIFICMIVPSKGFVDAKFIKPLNEFIKMYNKENTVILTDAIPHDEDADTFKKMSGATEYMVDGVLMYRWR